MKHHALSTGQPGWCSQVSRGGCCPDGKARCRRRRTAEVARKSVTLFKTFCKNREVGSKKLLDSVQLSVSLPRPSPPWKHCVYMTRSLEGLGLDGGENKAEFQEDVKGREVAWEDEDASWAHSTRANQHSMRLFQTPGCAYVFADHVQCPRDFHLFCTLLNTRQQERRPALIRAA